MTAFPTCREPAFWAGFPDREGLRLIHLPAQTATPSPAVPLFPDQSGPACAGRAFFDFPALAGVAAPPLCAVGSLLAQETGYASGFNMYGNRGYTRVLMIGDSMSVGGFGEGMAEWLVAKFGRASVAMYAACGSSPEHWLRNEPDYQTHCGYREITPRTNILYDYVGGRHPSPRPSRRRSKTSSPSCTRARSSCNWAPTGWTP